MATTMRLCALAALCVCGSLPAGAALAATRLECPASLVVAQDVSGLATGWTAVDLATDGGHRLLGAAVSEGPPQELRTLKPDHAVGLSDRGRLVQQFRWSRPPSYPVQLVCRFFGTTVVVHHPVGFDPRSCELDTVRNTTGITSAALRCE